MNNFKPSDEEIEQGYYIDDSEDGICLSCKEHSTIDRVLDEQGDETGEQFSSCCGAKIWIP